MIIPNLEALVRDFWTGTDWHDTFPREIEQAAPLKLPLIIAKQAPINAQAARNWLQQRGIVVPVPDDQRELHGCLVADRGHGFIFMSDTESPEEQRLTIAHEVAHFLADYLLPRQQVMQVLGPQTAEVLDGGSLGERYHELPGLQGWNPQLLHALLQQLAAERSRMHGRPESPDHSTPAQPGHQPSLGYGAGPGGVGSDAATQRGRDRPQPDACLVPVLTRSAAAGAAPPGGAQAPQGPRPARHAGGLDGGPQPPTGHRQPTPAGAAVDHAGANLAPRASAVTPLDPLRLEQVMGRP